MEKNVDHNAVKKNLPKIKILDYGNFKKLRMHSGKCKTTMQRNLPTVHYYWKMIFDDNEAVL